MDEEVKQLFYKGVDSFNAKDYYDAHEYFEEMWTEHKLEDRLFIQALIQLSVAYFHISNFNKNGAIGLFKKTLSKLNKYVDHTKLIININDVIKSAEISYESVIKINDISTFNWSLAPVLQIEDEK